MKWLDIFFNRKGREEGARLARFFISTIYTITNVIMATIKIIKSRALEVQGERSLLVALKMMPNHQQPSF